MVYDALDYANQVEELTKKHKISRNLRGAEFLSGISQYDKIKPIITLVIYFGTEEWNLQASKEKEKVRELFKKHKEVFSNFQTDAAIVLKECANVKIDIDEKRGEIDMCKAIDDMILEGKTEGRKETVIELYRKQLLKEKDAATELGMSVEAFRKMIEEYSV